MKLDQAIIVALGSNLSGAWRSSAAVLEDALDRLPSQGLQVVARSSWWRSAAWPDPGEPDYINAVALVETDLAAPAVLAALHTLEAEFGRTRPRPNAPRVLDLDLIAYGRLALETDEPPALILPHPRASDRAFVMGPLAEIAPLWRHPVSGRTARELAKTATVGGDAARLPKPCNPPASC